MTKRSLFVSVVIPAAGKGSRMKSDISKQFVNINGMPVIARTVKIFDDISEIGEIIVVCSQKDIPAITSLIFEYGFKKPVKTVEGGSSRQESVFNGIKACSIHSDILIVHDGARPFVSRKIILDSIYGAVEYGACCTGVAVKDTIKIVDDCGFISETLRRESLMSVQTPQVFKYDLIKDAYEKAAKENFCSTDDISLVERLGIKCRIIPGSYDNIKITTSEDLILAELIAGNYT